MIAACRWSYSGEGEATLRALASGVDSDALITTARRHRVQGLVNDALSQLGEPLAAALADDALAITQGNLRIAAELRALVGSFAAAREPMRILKGLPLAAQIYPRPFAKMSVDIDLLVASDGLERAAAILAAVGFSCRTPARMSLTRWHAISKESVWVRERDGIVVELHHRLADSRRLIQGIGLASPTIDVTILPGLIVPTFAPAEQFAYLAVHGISSQWFRAKWLSDVAALLHRSEDVGPIYRESQRLGAGVAAALALRLARELFDTSLSRTLQAEVNTPAVNRLAESALSLMTAPEDPTDRLFGTLPLHRAQLAMFDGPTGKLGEIGRQALAALWNRVV